MKTYIIVSLIFGALACLAVLLTGVARDMSAVSAAIFGACIGLVVNATAFLVAQVIDARRNR